MNEYGGYPIYKNTSVKYFPLGEYKFEELKKQLEKAKRFIFLEYFIVEEGFMWNSILEILEEKAKQGVDVRLIYDDVGCIVTLPHNYKNTLEAKGIKCKVFNPVKPFFTRRLNNRDHRKIVVIDGDVGFTGGINLADEYINEYEKHGYWKDAGIMLKGDAVWNLTVMFLSMWDYIDNKEEDYIKVHIGEENIPTLNNNSNNKENVSVSSSEYKNDIRLTKENPTMLIYHSHAGETYSDSPEGNYHSQNKEKSVIEVGTLLTEQLSKKGWGIAHSTKYHDYPDFTKSYISSLETVKSMLNTHKSINIAIDLHRDGRDLKTDADIQKEHERMSITYKGEKVAKFFFVVGMRNPNVNEVKSLAEDITKFAKTKYPELVLSVVEKPVGKFNQYMAQNHMLIEVGSNGTSSEEAKASAKYIAEILDEYYSDIKK